MTPTLPILAELGNKSYHDYMFLSVAQAAEKTGVPRRTINWAINVGQLPATRLGAGAWMIDPGDLAEWVIGRKTAS